MIRTTVTTNNESIMIHLPENYRGKKLEVFLYSLDELVEEQPEVKTVDNSSFRGALSMTDEQYLDFQHHAKEIRKEWNSSI